MAEIIDIKDIKLTLEVQGLTCTSCENKLNRVLSTTDGVNSVKTSLLLNRAELLYDENITSFKCRILHLNSNAVRIKYRLLCPPPTGIISVNLRNSCSYCFLSLCNWVSSSNSYYCS